MDSTAGTNFETIGVHPLTLHIGAEIDGVDFAKPLPDEQVRDIKAALNKWKVVFFRDQFIDNDQHIARSRQFGKPTKGHAVYGSDGHQPELYVVAKGRVGKRFSGQPVQYPWLFWHTDMTSAVNPPYASLLRAETVPPNAGDTLWTNLAAAYEALSPTFRAWLETLRAVHHKAPLEGVTPTPEYLEQNAKNPMVAEHPVVRIHPDTGEKVLFVSPNFLRYFVGLTPTESETLRHMLNTHIVRPEFTVRFRWFPGSIAMWDNRATGHRAPRDIYLPEGKDIERCLYRVTLEGPVPVGVDGKESVLMEGKPLLGLETEAAAE
jgi:alpha-ketoglutarate-dependent taurine dioxygenase